MDRILIILLYFLLFLVMYIDINKKYIPNILNFSILIVSIFVCRINKIDGFFIGASCYTLPILIFYGYMSDILKKEVFGFGDIKLIISLGGLLYQGEINIFLQIYIFYLLVFSLATLYIIIYIVISYCRNKSVKIKGVELAFAPYICIAFIIIYNSNLMEKIFLKLFP
ncbi:A24 family peptidase [Fusobacterium simiae]|uniref:A24 family peptidase n=1 Tax=Fusobacterium simiae TaxID=855 RepID=A0ABT4DKB8_FUSSI|nr:A24 family peptidase [Fusobacterium simiae]MCY7009035.1 A24 family peptidase [Fusobacterium simiae]